MKLANEVQGFASASGDEDFEAFVVSEIAENARVVRVIFDNEQDRLVGLEVFAIVGNLLRNKFSDFGGVEMER